MSQSYYQILLPLGELPLDVGAPWLLASEMLRKAQARLVSLSGFFCATQTAPFAADLVSIEQKWKLQAKIGYSSISRQWISSKTSPHENAYSALQLSQAGAHDKDLDLNRLVL